MSSTLSRRFLLSLVVATMAGPALANAEKKKEGEGQALDPTYKLGSMTIPIIANGRIVNYVFVALTLRLTSGADVEGFKAQEPALRDAIMRAAYRTPFVRQDTWQEVDGPRLQAFVLGQCAVLFGKGKVAAVDIAKQVPRQHVMPPNAAALRALQQKPDTPSP
ncbi:hypothetical protein [Caulobacter sp. X]|uniref:hypothetical protein n=1 Tax=Caulobacter sp. X TaxID=2048901 RepID=UPI000C154977|nr:hypothetical protein [Caulobacter sp. X]PIB97046.1 hypothetical protein CSW60_21470 [Caulobacter sp. X]